MDKLDANTRFPMNRLPIVLTVVFFLAGCSLVDISEADKLEAPAVRVREVTDLGVVGSPPKIDSRDGGYSAWFDDRSVWVYGDTLFKGKSGQDPEFHSNSWSWTKDRDASNGIGPFEQSYGPDGLPSTLLPFTDEEWAFNNAHEGDGCDIPPCNVRWALWPGAVIPDATNGRMLFFYEKVYIEPGELKFTLFGKSVAVGNNPEQVPERMRFNPDHDHPTLMFTRGDFGFGDAAVVKGPTLYVYVCNLQDNQIPCRVARVALERVFDKKDWETWTANGKWRKDLNKGERVFNGNEILSVSYNPYIERFLAVYSQPMSTAVMFRTAIKPEGPWSEPVEAFKAKAPANKIGWIYDALEHPEYRQDNGRILYITYSRQTSDTAFEIRLVSVRIERID